MIFQRILINPHIIRCHRGLSIREIPQGAGTDLIRGIRIPCIGCIAGYHIQNHERFVITGMTFHNLLCSGKGLLRIRFHRFHMMEDSYGAKCSHQNRRRDDGRNSFILFSLVFVSLFHPLHCFHILIYTLIGNSIYNSVYFRYSMISTFLAGYCRYIYHP